MRPIVRISVLATLLSIAACKQDSAQSGSSSSGGSSASSSSGSSSKKIASNAPSAAQTFSPDDADFLERMRGNMFASACWVADEIYFKNNGYKMQVTSILEDPTGQSELVITNPANGKQLRVAAKTLQENVDKGGKALADEIYERMQKEIGAAPLNPNAEPLQDPLFMSHDRQQKIRYPELFKKKYALVSGRAMQAAIALFGQGKREEAAAEVEHIALDRHMSYGEQDPLTTEAAYNYFQMTGKILVFKQYGAESWGVDELTPQEAAARGIKPPSLPTQAVGPGPMNYSNAAAPPANAATAEAEAANEIKAASAAWQANDFPGAISHAKKALAIRQQLYGPNDPRVAEVQKMIDAAQAKLPK